MPAGYSKRNLIDKLGIKPGFRACFCNPPDEYDQLLGPLPQGVDLRRSPQSPMDFIHAFFTTRRSLEARFPRLRDALAPAGMLWVSWPKKASGVTTDITEDVIREVALPGGLVDVKVCAVDETWSGLKLVRRKADRGKNPAP
jgi:hypothetical protein